MIGPPIVKCILMYEDDDHVLRIMRSAPPIRFGPMAESSKGLPVDFEFDKNLDPGYLPHMKIYPVLWKYYDNGLVWQIVSTRPIHMSGIIVPGSDIHIRLDVELDKRQWRARENA